MINDINDPSWPEILRRVQDQVQERIHTALPAKVRSYDVATQTAEVELVVQLGGEKVPPLADVPVCWPGGAAGFLHVPLAAGDTVMVVFAEEDFSGWFDTGSISAPAALTRHGLHAVAIPGLRRAAAPLTVTAGHVTLASSTYVALGADTATNPLALNNAVAANYTQLKSALDIVVGKLNALDPTATAAWNAAMTGWPASAAATKVRGV